MLGKFKTRFLFACIFAREACSIHAGWTWKLKMLLGKGSGLISAALGRMLSVFVPCVIATPSLFGQGTAGTIVGTVLDPSGATVGNASVSVKNQGTNGTRIAKTGADGG
jgi:hypothetical protein